MPDNQTDVTFFTNEAGQTLLERFKAIRLFDVLVGYYYGIMGLGVTLSGVSITWSKS